MAEQGNSNEGAEQIRKMREKISQIRESVDSGQLSAEEARKKRREARRLEREVNRKELLETFSEYYENDSNETVLTVQHVSMCFNLSAERVTDLKDYFIKMVKREMRFQEFWALDDVNFKVNKGDHLGILGLNGSGKSTLLKIVAGVLKPTKGSVSVKGKIVPLLELGAGFDNEYTGRENIFLYGTLLGYKKEFIQEKYNEIVKFSELGNFINVPLKNYSSGMRARLGFSIATVVEPEILILDEVLSVGDKKFRRKCMQKMKSMFNSDVTVLFVSHSLGQVIKICNKAILLEQGKIVSKGHVIDVAKEYERRTGPELFK